MFWGKCVGIMLKFRAGVLLFEAFGLSLALGIDENNVAFIKISKSLKKFDTLKHRQPTKSREDGDVRSYGAHTYGHDAGHVDTSPVGSAIVEKLDGFSGAKCNDTLLLERIIESQIKKMLVIQKKKKFVGCTKEKKIVEDTRQKKFVEDTRQKKLLKIQDKKK